MSIFSSNGTRFRRSLDISPPNAQINVSKSHPRVKKNLHSNALPLTRAKKFFCRYVYNYKSDPIAMVAKAGWPYWGKNELTYHSLGFVLSSFAYGTLSYGVSEALKGFIEALDFEDDSRDWSDLAKWFIVFVILKLAAALTFGLNNYFTRTVKFDLARCLRQDKLSEWLKKGIPYKMEFVSKAHERTVNLNNEIDTFSDVSVDLIASRLNTLFIFIPSLLSLCLSAGWLTMEISGVTVGVPYLVIAAILYATAHSHITIDAEKAVKKYLSGRGPIQDKLKDFIALCASRGDMLTLKGSEREVMELNTKVSTLHAHDKSSWRPYFLLSTFDNAHDTACIMIGGGLLMPRYILGQVGKGTLLQMGELFKNVVDQWTWITDNIEKVKACRDAYDSLNLTDEVEEKWEEISSEFKVDRNDSCNLKVDLKLFNLEKTELFGVKLEIKQGERIRVKGKQGSGKSLLLKAIAGAWPYAKGSISRPDSILLIRKNGEIASKGVMSLKDVIFSDAKYEEYKFQMAVNMLCEFDLHSLMQNDNKSPRDKRLAIRRLLRSEANWSEKLTDGPRQIIILVSALISEPKLLLLDNALDALISSNREKAEEIIHQYMGNGIVIFVDASSTNKLQTKSVDLERLKQRYA